MSDVVRELRNAIETEMQSVLGTDYKRIAYLNDISDNSFRQSPNKFGCKVLSSTQTDTVTKRVTFVHTFEIVISKQYIESVVSDEQAREKALDINEQILLIFQRLVDCNAGLPSKVLNVTNLFMEESEYLTEEKVVVGSATLDILYRINLSTC